MHLSKLPKHIPAGKILVHNQVYPVARRAGVSGSRYWLADARDGKYERCDCGFVPELGKHYRDKAAFRRHLQHAKQLARELKKARQRLSR